MPHRTLSLNLDTDVLSAALPLLSGGRVDALEWSFDALNARPELPDWFGELLGTYAGAGRLIGHGIFYSVCRADWLPEQADWLAHLRRWRERFPLDHLTEHFGFLTGRDFHRGAPIAPPLGEATLAVGRDRLLRLAEAADCPVGLENLALAYRRDDVFRQGEFLNELLEPVNGFVLLDAHNVYCQAHNFGVDPLELCRAYPLERVREVHLSGGSWEAHPRAPDGRVRRDTHDAAVPEAVFAMLDFLLGNCPALRYVTLEQLGPALRTEAEREQYRRDFTTLEDLIDRQPALTVGSAGDNFDPPAGLAAALPAKPLHDPGLALEQQHLSHLLETAPDAEQLRLALRQPPLGNSSWQTEKWDEHMVDTVWQIARKWR